MTKLNTTLSLITAAAFALLAQGAYAQASSPTRAEVKAETKMAAKDGKLKSPGEGSSPTAAPMKSDKSRAEVKAETKQAAAEGKLKSPGEGSTPPPATPAKTK